MVDAGGYFLGDVEASRRCIVDLERVVLKGRDWLDFKWERRVWGIWFMAIFAREGPCATVSKGG